MTVCKWIILNRIISIVISNVWLQGKDWVANQTMRRQVKNLTIVLTNKKKKTKHSNNCVVECENVCEIEK